MLIEQVHSSQLKWLSKAVCRNVKKNTQRLRLQTSSELAHNVDIPSNLIDNKSTINTASLLVAST